MARHRPPAGGLAPGEAVTIGDYEVRVAAGPGEPQASADDPDPLAARPADPARLADFDLEIDTGTGHPAVWPMPRWVAPAGPGRA